MAMRNRHGNACRRDVNARRAQRGIRAGPTGACDASFELSWRRCYRFCVRRTLTPIGTRVVVRRGPMLGNLQTLLDNANLAPHGICLLWRPALFYLHVISDALIAIAYFSIPFV